MRNLKIKLTKQRSVHAHNFIGIKISMARVKICWPILSRACFQNITQDTDFEQVLEDDINIAPSKKLIGSWINSP